MWLILVLNCLDIPESQVADFSFVKNFIMANKKPQPQQPPAPMTAPRPAQKFQVLHFDVSLSSTTTPASAAHSPPLPAFLLPVWSPRAFASDP